MIIMKNEFQIMISFRTPSGFKVCGQYFLGQIRAFAESVFASLNGREGMEDKEMLHLDLVEIVQEIPVRIKTISCKLSELCENCQYITRELFRDSIYPVSDNG